MAKWVTCQHCHGQGRITTWNPKKKTYEEITCWACKGSGKTNTGLV